VKGRADAGGVLNDFSIAPFESLLHEYIIPEGVSTVIIPAAAVLFRNCLRFIGLDFIY
jgi:hypothetical protein